MDRIKVSEELISLIKEDLTVYSQVGREKIEPLLSLMLDEARFDKMIMELLANIGDLSGGKILEVGCGYGAMLLYGKFKYGLDIYGLEPSKQDYFGRYELACRLLQENNVDVSRIKCGIGEHIPYDNETFDVVYSYQVLEHVENPFQVLAESWRVLKPGGILYINAPNFNTFFEGHYNIPWIPGLSKPLARIYLRLLGRTPEFVGGLNFLNQRDLSSWLAKICGGKVDSDYGIKDWQVRMRQLAVTPYTKPELKALLKFGKRMGIMRLFAYLGGVFQMQDTLRVAVRKNSN